MQKQTYPWRLFKDTNDTVIRYCSDCGKKVTFSDSGKRRNNANGKNLYEYAIYKCERDHTWNRLLKTYKTMEGVENVPFREGSIPGGDKDEMELPQLFVTGTESIEIILEEVTGKWRLDKLLGGKIPNASRSVICKMIESGAIRVDGEVVKQSLWLKKGQRITITGKES